MALRARDLQALAEFLEEVGKFDLFEYLELEGNWSTEEGLEAVKKRRRWAQGQRSNPKFKGQAIFVIKNSTLFEEIIRAPDAYRQTLGEREDPHTADDFCDYYALLSVSPSATFEEIEDAHRREYRNARESMEKGAAAETYHRLDEAWEHLSNPLKRSAYDVKHRLNVGLGNEWDTIEGFERRALGLLGPPGGGGEHIPFASSGESRLAREVRRGPTFTFGDRRELSIVVDDDSRPIKIDVEKVGLGLQPARIYSMERWIRLTPSHLDPAATRQRITIQIVPKHFTGRHQLGMIHLETGDGQRATLPVKANRPLLSGGTRRSLLWGGAITALLLGGFIYKQKRAAEPVTTLNLAISPQAERVMLDGANVGSGTHLTLELTDVKPEPVSLAVQHQGFELWERRIVLNENTSRSFDIQLVLTDPMNFEPTITSHRVELDERDRLAAEQAVERERDRLKSCLMISPGGPQDSLTLFLGPQGHPIGLAENDQLVEGQKACLHPLLRALDTPTFSGDYSELPAEL